ncbi:hypothetical protein VTN31DRAFT_4205 [Thermomyces dupontii]|uniref:uncharacterized protein n=1 Tax=Talaromyces thermophilus TaxID=28565 RepID=UPI003743AA72
MTQDSLPLDSRNLPTDSLILPTKRRFFPFKIPNFHHQLRHYISTADPDTIYFVSHKVVHSIDTKSHKWSTIWRIPFEPKCLAAGFGWIIVGGSDNGECTFIQLSRRSSTSRQSTGTSGTDVDSALPIDLDPENRRTSSEAPTVCNWWNQELGGSIVNSVTIHRFPAVGDDFTHEDVAVFSNNDKTVKVFSLTQDREIEILHHPAFMNYAIISPDSKVLAAVGDVNVAYFYRITSDTSTVVYGPNGEKLPRRKWTLLRRIVLPLSAQLGMPGYDDGSCFSIAFSPCSQLCAIGSQFGIITIYDVDIIRQSRDDKSSRDPRLHIFQSSRPMAQGGAVRSMAFSPAPWDLLVWVEDSGRFGVADVRSSFARRQIVTLNRDEPGLQKVITSFSSNLTRTGAEDDESESESAEELNQVQRMIMDILDGTSLIGENLERLSAIRESLAHEVAAARRDRQEELNLLNSARWSSRPEEDPATGPRRSSPQSRTRPNDHELNRSSHTASPLHTNDPPDGMLHDNHMGRIGTAERNLSQRSRHPMTTNLQLLLEWNASPLGFQPSEGRANNAEGGNDADADDMESDDRRAAASRSSGLFDPVSTSSTSTTSASIRQRSQRSRSISRRTERPAGGTESTHEPPRPTVSERRANVAAERLRRQRLAASEIRSPRFLRHILGDLPERHFSHFPRDQDPESTAGIGWGADGRTLYIGTVEGIFEFQINLQDRKTFPAFSWR